MSMENTEEGKQCHEDGDKVNILNLPPEILLKIFEFSVRDSRDVALLKKVCTKFSKVAQSAILHKHLIIEGDYSVRHLIPIIKRYGKTIKKLEIKNVSNQKVNKILQAVFDLNGLTSLKIKGVTLFTTDIMLIRDLVEHCKNLLSFKIVDVFDGRWDDVWIEVLEIISSRPMVEFSYPSTYPYLRINEWNINSFIDAKKDTLISLKIPLVRGVSMTEIAKCSKLKKLHLVKSDPYFRIRTETLYSLEILTSISMYARRIDEDDYLCRFFSRPCVIHLKSIELFGYSGSGFYYYAMTLGAIAKSCPNLEKLKISYSLWFSPEGSLANTLLKLLTSCKALKHISLPPMMLSDVLKIDNFLNVGNCPQLQYFQTTIKLTEAQIENQKYINIPAYCRNIFNCFNCSELNCTSYHCKVSYNKNIKNFIQ